MLRLKLINYNSPDKTSVITTNRVFRVYLGNGFFFGFRRKAEATAFLTDASEAATEWFLVANTCLVECYRLYRCAWPLLVNRGQKPLLEIRSAAGQYFENAQRSLDRTPRYNGMPKSNHYVIAGIMLTARECLGLVDVLQPFFKSKLDAVSLSELRQLRQKLETLLSEIEGYGSDHAARLEKIGINTNPDYTD